VIQILIGGDVCPMGSVERFFIEGDALAIFHDLLDEISNADLSVVNIECPLVSKKTPINKAGGAVLGASVGCIRGFAAAKWSLMNLANNHSFDQGANGLSETIQAIRQEGMGVVGAGSDIHEANTPFVCQIDGQRVVIYSMAEREFSIASERSAGANPLDLINFTEVIRLFKKDGVFVVLLHGGIDFPYPSPEMVRRCRFMVNMGADAVICSHPHRPLPWEIYRGRPIVYGMGNLVFEELRNPLRNPPPGWHDGYLVKLSIAEGIVDFLPIPYFQCRPVLGAVRMDDVSKQQFITDMLKRSKKLEDSAFLDLEWISRCEECHSQYISYLFGYNKWVRKMIQLLRYTPYSDEDVLRSLLLSQCETHIEVLNTIFRKVRNRCSN